MSLRDLYQEIIIDHGRGPRNFGKIAQANRCQAGHNPLCGDKLTIYIVEQDGVIEDVRFEGAGCAISVASASLMTEMIKGKNLLEIEKLFDDFHSLVTHGTGPDEGLGKLIALGGVHQFPVRIKCATLAWHTLKAALNNDSKMVTTE